MMQSQFIKVNQIEVNLRVGEDMFTLITHLAYNNSLVIITKEKHEYKMFTKS